MRLGPDRRQRLGRQRRDAARQASKRSRSAGSSAGDVEHRDSRPRRSGPAFAPAPPATSGSSATTMAPALCAALNGIATKWVLPIVPASRMKLRTVSGSRPALDRRRRLGRVERHREVDLAVVEQLMQRRAGGGIALAPGARDAGSTASSHCQSGAVTAAKSASPTGRCKRVRIGRQLDQDVLEEGAADEVGRRRIGEAARMRLGPVEQRRDRARRLRRPRRHRRGTRTAPCPRAPRSPRSGS